MQKQTKNFTATFSKILSFLFILVYQFTYSQTSVNNLSTGQVADFYQQAIQSGMSEMQIEQIAMAKGYTLTDIANMRNRIGQTKRGNATNGNAMVSDSVTPPRKQNGKLTKKAVSEDTVKSVVFGSELFKNDNLTFEPNLRIATPKNYQLGPDDELTVDISGNAAGNYKLRVSPDGYVKIPDLPQIYVSGMSFEDAKDKIFGRLRTMYSGLNAGSGTYGTVTLGNIRSIKVTITGEATKVGTYTVSSLATVFNALYLCGGPNDNGSFRNIQVFRNNKLIKTIDVYDFLLRADQSSNIMLHDQDIIHIPFYEIHVGVKGETKRGTAIYELQKGETFNDILRFAGGFGEKAYKSSITAIRNTDTQQQYVTVEQSKYATFEGKTGDRYIIGKILNRFENKVHVSVALKRSGDYALDANTKTIKQLIGRADGLREDAFVSRAVLFREQNNLEPEVVAIDLRKLLAGEEDDIELRNQDSLVIKSIKDLRENYFVTILGEVNNTGDTPYYEGMTVSDLITVMGGLKDGALGSRLEIARRIRENLRGPNDDETVKILTFKIDRNLSLNPNDAEFILKPYDILYVRKATNYEVQKSVSIVGEVNYPGKYAIVNNVETVSKIIDRAGGIKKGGYIPGAVLIRRKERIALDLFEALRNESSLSNLHLEDEDSLFIPEVQETVKIMGAVFNPSTVNFDPKLSFKNYISQAGGASDSAQVRRGYVIYANGYTQDTKRFLFFRKHPKIEPGSVIKVPFKAIKQRSDLTGPAILSFAGTLITAFILLFR